MATALYSAKIDHDGKIRVIHIFLGETDKEAQKHLDEHANICPKFGPAHKSNRTIDIPVEVDELPEADEESLEEFIGIDEEDEDEDADEEEEEEQEAT